MPIPASKQPQQQPLVRAVELIRVSTQGQVERDTPEAQRRALDQLRERRPAVIVERVEVGAVVAVSGAAALEDRPDVARLRELAEVRAFDELRVRSIDRLTRSEDPRIYFAIYGYLKDAGAVFVDASGKVIDPREDTSPIVYGMEAWMAAQERKRILERTLAGKKEAARKGRFVGRAPFGRTWDSREDKWGINHEEMAIYKRLFEEVLAGVSCTKIAKRLNEEGVPTPTASRTWTWKKGRRSRQEWTHWVVARLIHHESAVGEVKCFGFPIPGCPSVVTIEKYNRAQKILATRDVNAGRPPIHNSALLRGFVHCAHCGKKLWVRQDEHGAYYVCSSFRTPNIDRERPCRKYHAVADVDREVVRLLSGKVKSRLLDFAREDADEPRTSPEEEIKEHEKTLKRLDVEEERIARLYRKNLGSPRALEKQMEEIARERKTAEAALSRTKLAKETEAQRRTAEDDLSRRLEEARAKVDAMTASERFEALRALVTLVVRDGLGQHGRVLTLDAAGKLGRAARCE